MQKATLLMLLLPLKWQVTDPAFTWALHINKAVQETNTASPSTCLTSLQGFIKWLFSLQFQIVPTQLFLSKIGGQTWETVFILSAVYCCKDEMEQQSNIRNHWLLLQSLSCDVCNVQHGAPSLSLTDLCWFIELFGGGFLVVVFTP